MKKLILAIAAVALIAAPAMALDWDFYGSARIQTSYHSFDVGDASTNVFEPVYGSSWTTQNANYTYDDDDAEVYWDILGTSRIGARVKGDPVQGRFEFNNGVGTRLLWGQWKINSSLRLRVGQDWTPLAYFYSGQQVNDAGMAGPEGAGNLMTHRGPQLKLIIGEGQNLHIAAIDVDPKADTGTGDVDIQMPVIMANYHFPGDTFFFDVGGAYVQYDVESNIKDADSPDDTVKSWVVAGGGGLNFGPAYIKADIYYGVNVNEVNVVTNGAWQDAVPVANASGNWDDSDDWGALGVVGMRFTDQLAVEGGFGYENKSLDVDGPGDSDDETYAVYAHLNYTAAPGVSIIPEVGYVDLADNANGTDEGDLTYFSVKWQIDF
jgi:hypothetical protein